MSWDNEEEEQIFEWKDEDEEEIPGNGTSLSRINRIATVVFFGLIALGALYFGVRLLNVLGELFG